jgi:hypothetical protein
MDPVFLGSIGHLAREKSQKIKPVSESAVYLRDARPKGRLPISSASRAWVSNLSFFVAS